MMDLDEKVDAVTNGDTKDITAEEMSSLLMDPDVGTYEMYEDLAYSYLNGNNDVRVGINKCLTILTHYDFPEITDIMLKKIKEV